MSPLALMGLKDYVGLYTFVPFFSSPSPDPPKAWERFPVSIWTEREHFPSHVSKRLPLIAQLLAELSFKPGLVWWSSPVRVLRRKCHKPVDLRGSVYTVGHQPQTQHMVFDLRIQFSIVNLSAWAVESATESRTSVILFILSYQLRWTVFCSSPLLNATLDSNAAPYLCFLHRLFWWDRAAGDVALALLTKTWPLGLQGASEMLHSTSLL